MTIDFIIRSGDQFFVSNIQPSLFTKLFFVFRGLFKININIIFAIDTSQPNRFFQIPP
jgi:hypothetical protein